MLFRSGAGAGVGAAGAAAGAPLSGDLAAGDGGTGAAVASFSAMGRLAAGSAVPGVASGAGRFCLDADFAAGAALAGSGAGPSSRSSRYLRVKCVARLVSFISCAAHHEREMK